MKKKIEFNIIGLAQRHTVNTPESATHFHLAIAKGIADTLNIPAEEDTAYFSLMHLTNVQEMVSCLNEQYVLPCTTIISYVRRFYVARYKMVHNPGSVSLSDLVRISDIPKLEDSSTLNDSQYVTYNISSSISESNNS